MVLVKRYRSDKEGRTVAAVYPHIKGAALYEVITAQCRAYIDYERMVREEGEGTALYLALKAEIDKKLPHLGTPVFFYNARKTSAVVNYGCNKKVIAGKGDIKISMHVHFPDGPVFPSTRDVRRAVSGVSGIDCNVYHRNQQLWRLPYFGKEDLKTRKIEPNSQQKEVKGVVDNKILVHDFPQEPYERYTVSTEEEPTVAPEQSQSNTEDVYAVMDHINTHTFSDKQEAEEFARTEVAKFVVHIANGTYILIFPDHLAHMASVPEITFRTDEGPLPLSRTMFQTKLEVAFEPHGARDAVCNLWRGWDHEAVSTVPTELLESWTELFGHTEYLLQWVGRALRGHKTKVALVLYSEDQQVGKSFWTHFLARHVFAPYQAEVVGVDRLVNKFNSVLLGKLLVVCDEASSVSGDDYTGRFDRLKGMITNPVTQIEVKGKESFQISDYSNYILCSNHESPVKVESGDARYVILPVSAARKQDKQYFTALAKTCYNKQYAARFFHYCLAHSSEDYDLVANRPMTDQYREAQLASLTSTGRFCHFWAELASPEEFDAKWGATATSEWRASGDELYRLYVDWCTANGEKSVQRKLTFERGAGKVFTKIHTRTGNYYTVLKPGKKEGRLPVKG